MKLEMFIFFILFIQGILCINKSHYTFDNAFSFGVATSAYQIEGAWNLSGKGVNLWDHLTHSTNLVVDGSNGDIACNSYFKIDDDIKLLKDMGVNHYRFSISWSRILPTGMRNQVNWEGVAYYDELITKLLEANIEPWVTIYHFDHPYSIEILGGWFQPNIVEYLAEYADLLFYIFGERVKTWITINEPYSICVNGMAGFDPVRANGTDEYMCGENILKAHSAIYNLYQKKYKAQQHGQLSMAFNLQAYLPATSLPRDIEAAERINQFVFGWFVHPLVNGNYPQVMIDTIKDYSSKQGFHSSRLPELNLIDLVMLKGSYDFIGLNNYDTYLVSAGNGVIEKNPSYENDVGVKINMDPGWDTATSIQMKAKGIGVILKWIKETYDDPEIRIMEQGIPDTTGTHLDSDRHSYLVNNMMQLLKSINEDKVRLTGYTFWSFMDNFEWTSGYTVKYGLNYVNFTDPQRPRSRKLSSLTFSLIAASRSLNGIV